MSVAHVGFVYAGASEARFRKPRHTQSQYKSHRLLWASVDCKGPSGKEQRKSTGTCLISSSVTVSAMPVAETVTQPGHDAIQESFEPHIVKPLPLSLVYFSLLSWSSRAIMIERFNLSFRTSLLIVG